MSLLFDRKAAIVLGRAGGAGVEVFDGIDLSFDITKTITKEPNRGQVTIYNLSERTRGVVSSTAGHGGVFELKIGYGTLDSGALLIRGDIDRYEHRREEADWITTVSVGDGRSIGRSARPKTSSTTKFSLKDQVRDAIKSWKDQGGEVEGDSEKKAIAALEEWASENATGDSTERGAGRAGNKTEFQHGFVSAEPALDAAEKTLRATGAVPSSQNGVLTITRIGIPTEPRGFGPLLTPDTGLIGTPSRLDNGRIGIKALIQPSFIPGHRVRVEGTEMIPKGEFQILVAHFIGSRFDGDWYCDMEVLPL